MAGERGMAPVVATVRKTLPIGALAALLVLTGCTAPAARVNQGPSAGEAVIPSASEPSPTPTSAPSPTPEPTLAFAPPPGVLPPSSLASVTVNGLRIRETPGLKGRVLASVAASEAVWAGSWYGAEVDGMRWYSVSFLAGYRDWPLLPPAAPRPPGTPAFVSGFAAAGSAEQPYLELLPSRCPDAEPDLARLASMTGWERLACFGDRPLTVSGTWGCPYCDGTSGGSYEPMWLANPYSFGDLRTPWTGHPLLLALRFAPDSGVVPPTVGGSILRVEGALQRSGRHDLRDQRGRLRGS